jgi:hypothetical protein
VRVPVEDSTAVTRTVGFDTRLHPNFKGETMSKPRTISTKSQNELILRDLLKGKRINPQGALKKYQSFRLAARIYELKKDGHDIRKTVIKDKGTGNHYAEYYLVN